MVRDLRTYLTGLEKAGELLHIRGEINPKTELGGVAWQAQNKIGKATYFEKLKGYHGWRAVSYIHGSRKRIALALGTTPSNFIPEIIKRMDKGLTKCNLVNSGPVKETIWTDDAVDLYKIPIHTHSDSCIGPYIGGGIGIVKDPEYGIRNVSIHRHQLKSRNKLGIMMIEGRHMDLIYKKYEKRNEPMPIVIAIGHDAAYYISACWTTKLGVDEFEIAGTLMGEPVELVKCETIDLEAPAHAEIVIEGEVPPLIREQEGPFAEHTGYARAGSGLNPIVNVKAITMRSDAIYYALQGGRPESESQTLDGMPMEVVLFKRLMDVGGHVNLKDVVALPYAGGSHIVVIQMVPEIEGQVHDVLLAALSSPYIHPKIAIAVDEDVDPHDPKELFWSISTRVNPKEDVFLVPGCKGHPLDESAELITPKDTTPSIRMISKMGIDSTKPPTRTPDARDLFRRSAPMGLGRVLIDDYI